MKNSPGPCARYRPQGQLLFVDSSTFRYFSTVSGLAEIQNAINRTREDERKALSAWLRLPTALALSVEDEQRLLHSLDEASRDVDAGSALPVEAVRKRPASRTAN